jgi:hypothetical protein
LVWAAAQQLAGSQFNSHEEMEMVDGKWLRMQEPDVHFAGIS